MYRGYNLDLNWKSSYDDDFYEEGLKLFNSDKKIVEDTLDGFTLQNGKLDGTKIKENWFPQMENYDVFISHSHSNQKRAIAFAGWLFKTFEIRSFVDSCLWGYADDLLRLIDNVHCYQPESNTYNYTLRNYSTSHVHMMLSTALTMMIDNTECLFFLNTPNSITVSDVVKKTESPWIYAEIAATQVIRKKIPVRRKTKHFSKAVESVNERLTVEYEVDLSHLKKINIDTLKLLLKASSIPGIDKKTMALDLLYELTPIEDNFIKG